MPARRTRRGMILYATYLTLSTGMTFVEGYGEYIMQHVVGV